MNEDSNRDYLLRFGEATYSQLAKFAQESFGTEGRGVVLVEAPDPLPEGSLIGHLDGVPQAGRPTRHARRHRGQLA